MFKTLLITAVIFISTHAKAGFITTNEAKLDEIFSQASFGSMPIDIRMGLSTELVLPNLLDISTNAEVSQLFSMHSGGINVVNFYFIDTLSACGGLINSSYVGCGEYYGNDFVVESSYAAGSFGAELLAHELGHNLGLDHKNGNFLMNPFLNGNTTLTAQEVSDIHSNSIVQTNGQSFWIDILPIRIVAAATTPQPSPMPVPEPSTLLLLLLSLSLFFTKVRSKK